MRVKSTAGEVLDVGRDCAVTLEGGPELAEIRNAERAYERELYLASPAYREECARRESRAERMKRAAERAEVDCALMLACLRVIRDSARCSAYEHEEAAACEGRILSGNDTAVTCPDELGDESARKLRVAFHKATSPESRHVGAIGDKKVARVAMLEAIIPCETAFGRSYLHKFRSDAGESLVWFTASGDLDSRDVGTWIRVVGTVKAHKEYHGEAQTTLTRCKTAKI